MARSSSNRPTIRAGANPREALSRLKSVSAAKEERNARARNKQRELLQTIGVLLQQQDNASKAGLPGESEYLDQNIGPPGSMRDSQRPG